MNESADATVLVSRDAGVATITLNAPERLNAIDAEMGASLDRAFVDAATDPEVRAIVLTGRGRGFCAGASMSRLAEIRDGGLGDLDGDSADVFAPLAGVPAALRTRYTVPLAIPKPVIAAVNGPAAGAGLVLALACDIRIAAASATFVASFGARGLVAEGASAWVLPRIVGHGVASHMLLSATPVTAAEALRSGLVSAVEADMNLAAYAARYAQDIARTIAPSSLRFIKHQLRAGWEEGIIASADRALKATQEAVAGPDFREGLDAYFEKRTPRFAATDADPTG